MLEAENNRVKYVPGRTFVWSEKKVSDERRMNEWWWLIKDFLNVAGEWGNNKETSCSFKPWT